MGTDVTKLTTDPYMQNGQVSAPFSSHRSAQVTPPPQVTPRSLSPRTGLPLGLQDTITSEFFLSASCAAPSLSPSLTASSSLTFYRDTGCPFALSPAPVILSPGHLPQAHGFKYHRCASDPHMSDPPTSLPNCTLRDTVFAWHL